MKKIFLVLSLIMTVAVTSAFANSIEAENPQAQKLFNKQFAGAENVKWSTTSEGVLKVTFTWAGTRAEAYFDQNSELIATERNIFYGQVPLNVMRAVNTKYKNAIVLAVSEISTNGGNRYVISLEHGAKKYRATISSLGDIMEVEKIKK
jgi:hypothetical protein